MSMRVSLALVATVALSASASAQSWNLVKMDATGQCVLYLSHHDTYGMAIRNRAGGYTFEVWPMSVGDRRWGTVEVDGWAKDLLFVAGVGSQYWAEIDDEFLGKLSMGNTLKGPSNAGLPAVSLSGSRGAIDKLRRCSADLMSGPPHAAARPQGEADVRDAHEHDAALRSVEAEEQMRAAAQEEVRRRFLLQEQAEAEQRQRQAEAFMTFGASLIGQSQPRAPRTQSTVVTTPYGHAICTSTMNSVHCR